MVGSDDQEVSDRDPVATAMKLQLLKKASEEGEEDEIIETVTIIVMGDVRGTGLLNISQLVAMAKAITGDQPLSGYYLDAGDFVSNGRIDIADLTSEANLLLEDS